MILTEQQKIDNLKQTLYEMEKKLNERKRLEHDSFYFFARILDIKIEDHEYIIKSLEENEKISDILIYSYKYLKKNINEIINYARSLKEQNEKYEQEVRKND